MNTFYKIRDRRTGLFRTGGVFGAWNKHGKEWSSLGHIKQHLNLLPLDKIKWDDWEVVEYEYTPTEVDSFSVSDLLT